MASLNNIVLVGRLTAAPETRSTVEGLPMSKFRLAVTRPLAGGQTGTDYIDIVAWRKVAEICGEYLSKGQLVLVEGRIQNRSFEDQAGQRHWVTEVIARNIVMLEKSTTSSRPAASLEPPAVNEGSQPESEDIFIDEDELASDLPF